MTRETGPPDIILDHFVDQLARDPTTPAPADLEPRMAAVARRLAADAQASDARAAAAQARVWQGIMAGSSAVDPNRQRLVQRAPSLSRMRLALPHLRWLAAASLVILVLVGTAVGTSPNVQAQVRRLMCLVPGLGMRLCDPGALTSDRGQVVDSRDGLTLTVLQVFSDGQRTTVHVRFSGLVLPDGPDADQDQHVRDALPLVQAIRDAPVDLTDDHGRPVPPRPSADQTHLSGFELMPVPPRLAATAAWSFAALDPGVRGVDMVYHGPPSVGTWVVHVPLGPAQAAQLPVASDVGPAVTDGGMTLQLTGVARDAAGQVIVEVSARGSNADEQIGAVGTQVLDQNTWGLVAWDAAGHQYPASRAEQFPVRYEGDTALQDLVVQGVPSDAQLTALEVPSVSVSRATQLASISVPLAGYQVGEQIRLDETFHLGTFPVHVTGASLIAPDRLGVDVDLGGFQEGRELETIQSFQINGASVPPLAHGERTTDATGQHRSFEFMVPTGEPQVTLSFQGAAIRVAGPWRVPWPSPPPAR